MARSRSNIAAIARHVDVELSIDDWQQYGLNVPLLVNLQPAGEYLGEDYFRAGGVPAVISQLMQHGLIRKDAATVNGRTIGENCNDVAIEDEDVIRPFDRPLILATGSYEGGCEVEGPGRRRASGHSGGG